MSSSALKDLVKQPCQPIHISDKFPLNLHVANDVLASNIGTYAAIGARALVFLQQGITKIG